MVNAEAMKKKWPIYFGFWFAFSAFTHAFEREKKRERDGMRKRKRDKLKCQLNGNEQINEAHA